MLHLLHITPSVALVVAGCNDRSVGNADSAIPNMGGAFLNHRDVTIVMKCKSAIITAEEVAAETAQIAYIVIKIIDGGRISPFPPGPDEYQRRRG